MACKGAIERNNKYIRNVKKTKNKKLALLAIRNDVTKSSKERLEAQKKIEELGPFTRKVRIRNRCAITGDPRSYNRKFGISRNSLRELASYGLIPGLSKASW